MRTLKRKYKRPKRPWDSARIAEEKQVMREFGLRRKKEIRRAESIIRDYRRRARNLIAVKDDEKTKILIEKLVELGLIEKGNGLENVLLLDVVGALNRRLQTIIFKKGFASTIQEARQKISHGHVHIEGRAVKFPSYIVPIDKEKLIKVKGGS
ncbi:MAG: 30S ribosomal protein S4 [Candidatus Aenigmarchaeota archaeon]|nr:30S ribosomal protein S4 [Candidatus Aenigmarchaeota archaeon]